MDKATFDSQTLSLAKERERLSLQIDNLSRGLGGKTKNADKIKALDKQRWDIHRAIEQIAREAFVQDPIKFAEDLILEVHFGRVTSELLPGIRVQSDEGDLARIIFDEVVLTGGDMEEFNIKKWSTYSEEKRKKMHDLAMSFIKQYSDITIQEKVNTEDLDGVYHRYKKVTQAYIELSRKHLELFVDFFVNNREKYWYKEGDSRATETIENRRPNTYETAIACLKRADTALAPILDELLKKPEIKNWEADRDEEYQVLLGQFLDDVWNTGMIEVRKNSQEGEAVFTEPSGESLELGEIRQKLDALRQHFPEVFDADERKLYEKERNRELDSEHFEKFPKRGKR